MKCDINILRDLGVTEYDDLNLVRVRPDGKNMGKIDELLSKSEFPFYHPKEPSDLPYAIEGYFKFVEELEDIDFPFTEVSSFSGLFYNSLDLGLACLEKWLGKELFHKVRIVVCNRLAKGIDWEREIKMMVGPRGLGFEEKKSHAVSKIEDIPKEIRAKTGNIIINNLVKHGVLTVQEWNQRETGYKNPNVNFSDFYRNKEEMIFCSEKGGNPAQRLKLVTDDQDYKDLYISWAVLRTKKDLKEEDEIEPEIWVAHNGKVYSDQDHSSVLEAEEFDVDEQEIINWEIQTLRERFESWCNA